MNVLITKPANNDPNQFTFVSAIAYGAGTNTTRAVIGDQVTMTFAVRWLDQLSPVNSNGGQNYHIKMGFTDFQHHLCQLVIHYSISTYY